MLHILKRSRPARIFSNSIRSITKEINREVNEEESDDVFGLLSRRGNQYLNVSRVEQYHPDDKDGYDEEEFDLTPRKNHFYYKYKITEYARQGSVGLRKALELFRDMKSKDRLTPTIENFSPLIYGCAKAGYTKKAFDLYKESLNYYNKPSKSTVTCLINACGESPHKEYGLKKLDWLREHLKFEYNYSLNEIQYRSAIKAYGKLGQLEKASKIVEEMIQNGMLPDTETFNMLLIGCASDKECGSTIALRLYKRMRYYNLKPNLITFRLMLRCIRDCEFGSSKLLKETFLELPALTNYKQRLQYKNLLSKRSQSKQVLAELKNNFEWLPLITDLGDCITSAISNKLSEENNLSHSSQQDCKLLESEEKNSIDCDNVIEISSRQNSYNQNSLTSSYEYNGNLASNQMPNLLSDNHYQLVTQIEAIQFDKLKSPNNRLILFGGLHGYLEMMSREGCKPDNKTFCLLLQCIKQKKLIQMEFLRLSKDYGIKRDLLFYDLLIRHMCSNINDSDRLQRALDLFDEMFNDGVRPNITTFESLALGCDTWKEANRLISDVEKSGFVISNVMIRRFFDTAYRKSDYNYLIKLIELSINRKYEPPRNLIDSLEELRIRNRELVIKYEGNNLSPLDKPDWLDDSFVKLHDMFSIRLKNWLKSVNVLVDEHPWSQFYVESTAKRMGFRNLVQQFKKLEETKQKALENGEEFGILAEKAGIIK